MVFQKVHWQLLTVTVRFPAEEETTECAPLSSKITTFFQTFSYLTTKSSAYGVSIWANCSSADSGANVPTLFLTMHGHQGGMVPFISKTGQYSKN